MLRWQPILRGRPTSHRISPLAYGFFAFALPRSKRMDGGAGCGGFVGSLTPGIRCRTRCHAPSIGVAELFVPVPVRKGRGQGQRQPPSVRYTHPANLGTARALRTPRCIGTPMHHPKPIPEGKARVRPSGLGKFSLSRPAECPRGAIGDLRSSLFSFRERGPAGPDGGAPTGAGSPPGSVWPLRVRILTFLLRRKGRGALSRVRLPRNPEN